MTTRVEPPPVAVLLADNERLRALAASVIHDFNNFAAAIGGYSELVLQRLTSEDDHVRAGVRSMRDAATWGVRITRRLMAAAGRSLLPSTRLAVDAALTDAEPALRLLVGTGRRLILDCQAATGIVQVHPGEFEQMLVNLVITAREAVDADGIIGIVTDTVRVDEAGRRAAGLPVAGDYVRVSVSDTGRRVSETTGSRAFPGGYGLATVHDIVTRNGGAVSVTSGPGAGSTFEVYLPQLDNVVLERFPMPDVEPHHGTETVLVVENEEPVREMIVDVLSLHGYTALAAADGEEALRIVSSHRGALDLIIVDVVMPGISGEALAQRLTAGRPGVRVLYISGYTDDLVRQHGFLRTSGHFLQKPFSVDDLAQKVHEVLRGRVA
jgi:two-component system, cell cycle sensor histidine kinase and response regulator CckA